MKVPPGNRYKTSNPNSARSNSNIKSRNGLNQLNSCNRSSVANRQQDNHQREIKFRRTDNKLEVERFNENLTEVVKEVTQKKKMKLKNPALTK